MRAVVQTKRGPISEPDVLGDVERPRPEPQGRDLLVSIRAVSVNPVDVKLRAWMDPPPGGRVLGWDAAGVVEAVGPECRLYAPGDAVWYAGAVDRPGTNAEYHLVDERIVGPKPATLDFEEAAAMPLTTITAWEALFDRLDVERPVPGAAPMVLVIGGAGGVASMAVQLLRARTDLIVVATAKRPESREWLVGMGAHHVIDHSRPLAPQIEALGLGRPGHVFSTTHTGDHLADIVELIAPQGRLALIDDPENLDVMALKRKGVSLHWENMFARSFWQTPDIEAQHDLLREVARLVDEDRVRSTLTQRMSPISAATLRESHARVETDAMIGKLVISGWN